MTTDCVIILQVLGIGVNNDISNLSMNVSFTLALLLMKFVLYYK